MGYNIRTITDDDLPRYFESAAVSFGEDLEAEDVAAFARKSEVERLIAAFDGDAIVSTTGAFSFVVTVPGNEVPAAGVTIVGVQPTHRRRGILTAMMRSQLEDVHRRGEPLAVLWASESNIYQRFGYGMAFRTTSIDIERERALFSPPGPQVGRTRLLSTEEALLVFPDIYDRVRTTTPGMYKRGEAWWEAHSLRDSSGGRKYGRQFRAVWELDDTPHAYAVYRYKDEWNETDGTPAAILNVREILGLSPVALREMWRFLFGIDLVRHIKAWPQPLDNPLFHMLAEPRRLRPLVADGVWLRVVDVVAALEARTYLEDGTLTFELQDTFCPWNGGRYRLEVKGDEARVREATGDVDLTLGASDLGAVYLGDTSFDVLTRAGRIIEHTDGSIARADALFHSLVPAFCPEVF